MLRKISNREFDLLFDINRSPPEEQEMEQVANWLINQITPNETNFIEVGAHIGFISTIIQTIAQPQFALYIEPDPRSILLLRENLARNTKGNYQIINHLILDKELVKQDFYLTAHDPALNSIHPRHFNNENSQLRISLPTTTIDNLIKKCPQIKPPIVMKIDTEFSEPLIWLGMKETLPKVQAICLEYYPDYLEKFGHNPQRFLQAIESAGFIISQEIPNNLCLTRPK